METFLPSILPDAFSGALFALEGIKDSIVVLNGPTGCKFYHAAVSGDQLCRGFSYDPVSNPERYYFRQNRIPCTFLDDHDFVYGAKEKLEGVLNFIKEDQFNYLALVNSPGAALIGDDLEAYLRNAYPDLAGVCIENTGFSAPFHQGFSDTLLQVLQSLAPQQKPKTDPRSVNLVGISIYHKYFEGEVQEMKRLLSLCGISVKTTMLAGDSTAQLSRFAEAELNIILQPEFGKPAAMWMEKEYGIPYLEQETGMCIGFDATESLVLSVCKQLGVDFHAALEDIKRARARAFANIYSFNSLTGLPKGAYFSIKAEASFAYSMTHFLYSYLGMLPECIDLIDVIPNDPYQKKLLQFLEEKDLGDRLGSVGKLELSSLLLADANSIAQTQLQNDNLFGIEISLPGFGYTHVIPRALTGVSGCLYLLEQIINGLRFIKR